MKTITRTKYLNRIIDLNKTPDIKIITGIRRSGKSKLMQAYIETAPPRIRCVCWEIVSKRN